MSLLQHVVDQGDYMPGTVFPSSIATRFVFGGITKARTPDIFGNIAPMREIWGRSAIWGIGSGDALLMSASMRPDANKRDRSVDGKRREGMISSICSITRTLGRGLSPSAPVSLGGGDG